MTGKQETKPSEVIGYGIRYVRDPQTGELIGQPLTREEALESDRQFSEKFEPDFTPKAVRKFYSTSRSESARKSQP